MGSARNLNLFSTESGIGWKTAWIILMLFVAVIFGEQMLLLCYVCFIEVINNNRIDAKYCQMAFQSVLVHLPEILEE